MLVGFLTDLRNPGPWERSWPQHYGRSLELIEEAERLGAGAIFVGEHHLTSDGYIPQPLTFAAAIAARTSHIRIGTGLTIAPLRHPMHIAEEAAVVDVLSGGRVDLGLGAGYRPVEFAAFGIDRSRRFDMFYTSISEVRRLLEEVTPRPVQERLPIWVGAFSGVAARRAGLLGEGLLSMRPELLGPYLDGLRAGGHDPSTARMGGPLTIVVCDDPERTAEILRPHIEYHSAQYASYLTEAEVFDGRKPSEGPQQPIKSPAEYNILTPQQAIAYIRPRIESLPIAFLNTWLSIGGMPDDIVERHITLMLTEVAPALP